MGKPTKKKQINLISTVKKIIFCFDRLAGGDDSDEWLEIARYELKRLKNITGSN